MSSTRAAEVAELLWELKRAGKVATYSAIARRAGFSAGTDGKTIRNCISTIRRDWPHLQWWRAIDDAGTLKTDVEQAAQLKELGIDLPPEIKKGKPALEISDELLMVWEPDSGAQAAVT